MTNQQNGKYAQRRLRSAWTSAQTDQSSLSAWRNIGSSATHWAHSEDSDRSVWSESSQGAHGILLVLSWGSSNVLEQRGYKISDIDKTQFHQYSLYYCSNIFGICTISLLKAVNEDSKICIICNLYHLRVCLEDKKFTYLSNFYMLVCCEKSTVSLWKSVWWFRFENRLSKLQNYQIFKNNSEDNLTVALELMYDSKHFSNCITSLMLCF